ncbi:MAG: putative DNA binding domain-containing protein [Anaerolineaceae bacterium]|nr:putative DNA binding domain-containing protein [Anaerolineaceae bacterium]
MIDFSQLENYRENNRIEAKKALGGLPQSIWETVSAFANTMGGMILLGVEEYRDKSFHTVDLPDPEGLAEEFWALVNDPKKVSTNILSRKNIIRETVNGCHILIITVPRADRSFKPIYCDGNPQHAYRRNGEGDYRCTEEEYQAMVRDASKRTQDMQVLEELDCTAFDPLTIRDFRQQMGSARPGHIWESLNDEDFLLKIGAVCTGEDGKNHPTAGGLLLFGTEKDIPRFFPHYSLEYREQNGDPERAGQIRSSGNLLNFYSLAAEQILCGLDVPLYYREDTRKTISPVRIAIREALANCIVNADYYGGGGLVITRESDQLSFSNPGSFRIDVEAAKHGGSSDPRNALLLRTLNLIDIGENAGSGIPNIFRVWRKQNLPEPEIIQSFNPDRITLVLPLAPSEQGSAPVISGNRHRSAIKAIKRQMIIDYLTEHVDSTTADLSAYLGLRPARVRDYLRELIRDRIVIAFGSRRDRKYKLKA